VIFSKFRMLLNVVTLWLAYCLFVSMPLCHAEDNFISEQAYLQDFPVVLSASRLSQPLSEAPNAMTVIDRAMIQASGFRTITDLFRLVPGMYVGNVSGHDTVVGYHGVSDQYSRRMQVLIDGRSVYLPPFSTVDWEDIPLNIDDIERIEVVRGPAAGSYGANSLQGVINIITRDAGSVGGLQISGNKGSYGVADVAAHMGQAGEILDYRLTLSHREDNGYGASILNDGLFSNQANLRANYHPLGPDSFDFQLGYSDSRRGLGTAGKVDDLFRDVNATSGFQQLTWLHTQENGDETRLHFYHIYRNYIDGRFSSANAIAPVTQLTSADRQDLELQNTIQLGKSNRMVAGLGVRSDYVKSPDYLVVPYAIHESRIFAHDEWRIDSSTLLNIGAMAENDGLGNTNTSPRVALNYHINPQHTLRASASVAYRTPAIIEEYINDPGLTPGQSGTYVSQGNLRPEKIQSKEIGYLGEFSSLDLTLDVRAYDDHVSDIIFYDPALTYWPFGFANLYSANYHGYEGTLKYHWNDSNNVIVNVARQFMSCDATGTLTNPGMIAILQGFMDGCLSQVPDYSGSILLTRRLPHNTQVSAGYYFQSSLTMIDAIPQTMMNRVDFKLTHAFGVYGKPGSGELALVVQNVFQDNYSNYSLISETSNLAFGRRAYLSAAYNF